MKKNSSEDVCIICEKELNEENIDKCVCSEACNLKWEENKKTYNFLINSAFDNIKNNTELDENQKKIEILKLRIYNSVLNYSYDMEKKDLIPFRDFCLEKIISVIPYKWFDELTEDDFDDLVCNLKSQKVLLDCMKGEK